MKSDRQMKGVGGGGAWGRNTYVCLGGRKDRVEGGRKNKGHLNSSDQEEHRIFAL